MGRVALLAVGSVEAGYTDSHVRNAVRIQESIRTLGVFCQEMSWYDQVRVTTRGVFLQRDAE